MAKATDKDKSANERAEETAEKGVEPKVTGKSKAGIKSITKIKIKRKAPAKRRKVGKSKRIIKA